MSYPNFNYRQIALKINTSTWLLVWLLNQGASYTPEYSIYIRTVSTLIRPNTSHLLHTENDAPSHGMRQLLNETSYSISINTNMLYEAYESEWKLPC